ncbi:RNA polymerase sigma factor [Pseudotenacibaculum sp. MALMAid0570]|uniref:RNA polymerase sigma factor n=1 Tax=Pseudotenacibaculum sp. MALMAid0570 TaxID=3143938 RepID=UPI0032DED038
MTSETENEQQLKTFFSDEYHNLKAYVHSKIEDSTDRDAEDIIQDVALKILSRNQRSPVNNIAGFFYHSIKNRIIDLLRKKQRYTHAEESFEDQFNDFVELFYGKSNNIIYSEEMKLKLKDAIFSLKPAYKDIILAVDIEGYSYKEIAIETGIPEGTLLSRRHRAISQLHKKLESLKDNIN